MKEDEEKVETKIVEYRRNLIYKENKLKSMLSEKATISTHTKNNTMKKLLLLLLIAPIIGNSQIGNIFPTDIKEIISIADGEFYHIPEGYVFQPMIGKESSLSVFATNFIPPNDTNPVYLLILTEEDL